MERQSYWNRRLTRRRALAGAMGGTVGLAGLALAGCGGDDDAKDERPIEQKQAEVKSILWTREDTTAQAVKGGNIESRAAVDWAGFDPLQASGSYLQTTFGAYVYPRLLQYKLGYRVPAIAEVEAGLAEKWEQPDPTTMILHLRQNQPWDERAPTNKRLVDAEDVVFSWNKMVKQGQGRTSLVNSVDSNAPVTKLEAPDKFTVKLTLAFPYAPLPLLLAYARYFMVMPKESDGGFDPRTEVRGAGAWNLANYQKGVITEFRKNPNWWGADKTLPGGVNLPLVTEPAVALAQFKAKKIWTSVAQAEDVIPLKKEFPELLLDKLAFGRGQSMIYFGLGPDSPFANPLVRRAVSMMVDRDAYLETFDNVSAYTKEGYPMEVRWYSHISGGWDGMWVDPKSSEMGEGGKNFQFNIAEAKKMIAAAGYPNGIDTEIAYTPTGYGSAFAKRCEVIIAMLQEGGFKLKVVNPDYPTEYLTKYYRAKGEFKGIALGATTQFPEIDQYLFSYFHKDGDRQKSTYKGVNADVKSDDLIAAQRKELDNTKRVALIKEWQKHVATTMPQVLFPGAASSFSLTWPWVGNTGVFRSWDAESETPRVFAGCWYDKSKYTG